MLIRQFKTEVIILYKIFLNLLLTYFSKKLLPMFILVFGSYKKFQLKMFNCNGYFIYLISVSVYSIALYPYSFIIALLK